MIGMSAVHVGHAHSTGTGAVVLSVPRGTHPAPLGGVVCMLALCINTLNRHSLPCTTIHTTNAVFWYWIDHCRSLFPAPVQGTGHLHALRQPSRTPLLLRTPLPAGAPSRLHQAPTASNDCPSSRPGYYRERRCMPSCVRKRRQCCRAGSDQQPRPGHTTTAAAAHRHGRLCHR